MSLVCHPVGGAILLRDGTPDQDQAAFAAWLAADPDHTVVVCDLAEEYTAVADGAVQAWEPVVQALAATAGSLRLVPWRRHPTGLLHVGELLGRRLARVVVAADGHPVMSAGGGLFVPPDAGTGWYRTGPGQLPRRDSRRFPKPKWTAWAPLEDQIALSPGTTLRPLPSGAWLSPEGSGNNGAGNHGAGNHGAHEHGQWLYRNVDWSHDTINVVLGQPGAPPVPAADVARLWWTLSVKARQRVQFVPYGTPVPSRQELADAIGGRVTVAAPLSGPIDPVGATAAAQPATATPAVSRPAPVPGSTLTGATVPDPVVSGPAQPATPPAHPERQRVPPIRLESGPTGGKASKRVPAAKAVPAPPRGSIRYAAVPPRAAMEPPEQAAVVRDEEREAAVVRDEERETDGAAARIAASAEDAGAGYASVPVPAPASSPAPDPARAPAHPRPISPSGREVLLPISLLGRRVAPLAEGSAPAVLPGSAGRRENSATAKDEERDGAAARIAARAEDAGAGYASVPVPAPASSPALDSAPAPVPPSVSALSPGASRGNGGVRVQPVPARDASAVYLDGGLEDERQWLQQSLSKQFSATASSVARVLSQNPRLRGGGGQEVVADLVAVRLYLTEYGQRIDDNVRTGQPGSHVLFARCVNAGLRRLPSHRGPVRLRATLSEAEWRWYGGQRLVTEWAFCPGLFDGTVPLPGKVDFLIWSATARRTVALAPDVPGQVIFLPGTRFKVLEVRDGERRAVLLRELSALETASGDPLEADPVPLDEIALTGLGKANVAWAGGKQGTELPREHAPRFGNPPGLISHPQADPEP